VSWLRRLAGTRSYANVISTLALFVSLAGVSYAAVTLPAGSVGRKQLQPGAVAPTTLSFPVGSTDAIDRTPIDLTKGGCNGGGFPGNAAPPCTPERHDRGVPASEIHLRAMASGRLAVFAIANVKNEGSPQTTARVTLWLEVDNHLVAENEISTTGGQAVQVPIQGLAPIGRGLHGAGLGISANYSSSGPGDVIVTDISVIGSASSGTTS